MPSSFATTAVALLVAAVAAQEQLHLSLTGRAGEMALDFVVHPATATGIRVTLDGSVDVPVNCKTATLNKYEAQFCMALFKGLAANSKHTYVASSSVATSATYSFTSEPSARPPIVAVYADFGLSNDLSLKALVADAAHGGFDMVGGLLIITGVSERASHNPTLRRLFTLVTGPTISTRGCLRQATASCVPSSRTLQRCHTWALLAT